jgi:hypothetical protein
MDRLKCAAMAVIISMTTSACATPEPANVVPNDMKSARGSAEPTVLADLQLDSVTAAGVLVDVSSIATALGDFGDARTGANTFVVGGEYLDLGVGTTMGQALACCGEDADVAVGSAAVGAGDMVHGITHSVEHDGRFLDLGLSVGFVLALSVDKHFAAGWVEHVAMLEQWHAALAGRHLEPRGAAMPGAL